MIEFSIIIPCFNAEKTITNTIQSVLNQTFSNFEIICIDDYSLDSTYSIINSISNIDNRIISKKLKKNSGPFMARLQGLEIAQGNYIMFLDSDDLYEKKCLEVLSKKLKNNHVDILQFGYIELPSYNKILQSFIYNSEKKIKALISVKNHYSSEVWTKVYSRKVIQKSLPMFEKIHAFIAEDVYFSIVTTYNADSFNYIKYFPYFYSNENGISTTKTVDKEKLIKYLSSYQEVFRVISLFFNEKIPEINYLLPELEFYFLKDFIDNRLDKNFISDDFTFILSLITVYFSKRTINEYCQSIYSNSKKYYSTYVNHSFVNSIFRFLKLWIKENKNNDHVF